MRIYDTDANKKTNNLILYLTVEEAQEMKGSIEDLLTHQKHHHAHVSDKDFKREVTLCLYREDDVSGFDERSKNLILRDE